MPRTLSRDEARRRAALLDVTSYAVELDLTGLVHGTAFTSTTVVSFACREPGATTFLELDGELLELVRGGAPVRPDMQGNRIVLADLAAHEVVRVVARCTTTRTGEGLHRSVDPADGQVYLYAQAFLDDAQRIFACFDQPDLKARVQLTVTAPAAWTVLANTRAVRDGARHVFAPTEPIATYLVTLAAGPWHGEQRWYGGVELGVWCRASLAAHLEADELFTITAACLDVQQDIFGRRYPFGDTYDQVFVPEFNAGAMENPGMVTFSDQDFVFRSRTTQGHRRSRAQVIAHEMAHMWFGDLVTMQWWDDLWLNESFAEFMAYHAAATATRFKDAWTGFATSRKAWGYRQDQLPSTHPIAADAPDLEAAKANFDGITYAKGASVLKQLVAWVGLEHFLAGVRTYFDKHAWGNTRLVDLLTELETTSGRDLAEWSKEWLQTAGCNTLRPSFLLADDGTYSSFLVEQEAPDEHPTLRSHRIAIGLYDRTDAGLVRRSRFEIDVVGPVTEVPDLVGQRQPDLLLLNDDDLTFAKVRLDERSLATLTGSVGELAESLPRALCWSAAWDMTRDAEMRARDFVQLVAGGVGSESDIVTVQSVLRQAQAAVDLYVAPDHRDAAKATFATAMHGLVRSAEPGSDHQLAFVRSLSSLAAAPAQLDLLQGLLDGSAEVPGLAVDTELRWAFLRRLVAAGRLGDDAIEAELDRDSTASGERHAATVRAGRPTAEAKARAWAAVVDTDDLPNALQTATIAGILDPGNRELLRPYIDRYFASVGPVWASRSPEMASNIVVGLYPALFVEPEVVAKTDAYLADEKPPAALARLLAEGRDGVQRALRCQALDASA